MKHFLTSALGVIGAGIAAAFGGWEAVELPPEGDIDPAEALDIILGGESA